MKRALAAGKKGFSLIEVVMAIGVISFALVAMIGMFGVGMDMGRKSSEEMIFARLSTSLLNELRLTNKGAVPSSEHRYYDWRGLEAETIAEALYKCEINATPVGDAELPGGAGNLALVTLKFTWPASAAAPTNENLVHATVFLQPLAATP